VTVGDATTEADVGLDRRAALLPVKDRSRRFELDALVGAVQ
jgi:hypothetical protein